MALPQPARLGPQGSPSRLVARASWALVAAAFAVGYVVVDRWWGACLPGGFDQAACGARQDKS